MLHPAEHEGAPREGVRVLQLLVLIPEALHQTRESTWRKQPCGFVSEGLACHGFKTGAIIVWRNQAEAWLCRQWPQP